MKPDQPILITGASSGIGNHLVRTLSARGLTVFATARKPADLAELGKLEHVIPLQMDVRDPQQIKAAVQQVQEAGRGLYGLVNNAGVGELGFLTTWDDHDLYDIFDVNVFGVHRVTNAFIDLLLESHGRVVNIGSQGGMITKKYYGPYTMTKHALEAYTVALDLELQPHGARASIVQPGGIVSDIGDNSFAGTRAHFASARPPFKEEADQILAALDQPQEGQEESEEQADQPESEGNRKPSSPQIVSEAVLDALFSEKPKLRYLVGTRWEGDRVIHALLAKLLDENDNPRHNYSREQLIELLDQHLSARQG